MTPKMLHISEAAALALHTMAVLARSTDRLASTHEIAEELAVSENHLAKVRQQLARAGLVEAVRGPSGGFRLTRPPSKTSLMEVYEAIEGPYHPSDCLLGRPACRASRCVLGGLVHSVNGQVRKYLAETTLAHLAKACESDSQE
ncbi:MAG: Rrf2 family transcriptional regulator [Armatimonadetes bacterium]|nr:Rrf2 family transcriptional regulator [Armatimonadota bacterium]